jgi:hypothetical protein
LINLELEEEKSAVGQEISFLRRTQDSVDVVAAEQLAGHFAM